jgi:hypothetical protein
MASSLLLFKAAVMVIMLLIFLLEANICYNKWKEEKTSLLESSLHVTHLLYPSVSFCKRYTYNSFLDGDLLNSSSLEEAKRLVKANVSPLEQVVTFLTHPGMRDNMTFPCITNQDGTDPGKPCSFPDENNQTGCRHYSTLVPMCYTRCHGFIVNMPVPSQVPRQRLYLLPGGPRLLGLLQVQLHGT